MVDYVSISAVFIGRNSLGYINGKTYSFRLSTRLGRLMIYGDHKITPCDYTSWNSFIRNWKIFKIDTNDIAMLDNEYLDSVKHKIVSYSRRLKFNKIKIS